MSAEDELIAEAEIGEQAREFLESELGKTLLGMAQQEVLLAQEALEVVDPTQTEKIRALQNQAKIGRNFEDWLKELITKGENALNVWRQQNV
jgi:DNA segregation ATPase FtsK/SpoIIIE-like protein